MIGTPKEIGFYLNSATPDIDERCFKDGVPYASTADVLATIPMISRAKYLTVNIAGVEYWFSTDALTTLTVKTAATAPTAAAVPIVDAGNIYDATNVEDALQEVSGDVIALAAVVAALAVPAKSVYEILLPASGTVAGRISGATIPSGWTISAASSVNLLVTHTMTGRKIASVNVYEINGANERLSVPFQTAYSGVLANGLTVLIEGLNPSALALRIEMIFA